MCANKQVYMKMKGRNGSKKQKSYTTGNINIRDQEKRFKQHKAENLDLGLRQLCQHNLCHNKCVEASSIMSA